MIKIKYIIINFTNYDFYIYLIEFNCKNNRNSLFNKSIYYNFPKTELNATNISLLEHIISSKNLYINDSIITPEYITLIKNFNIKNESIYMPNNSSDVFINASSFEHENQINWIDYYNLCKNGKMIEPLNKKYPENPLISIILSSFNKEKDIFVSIKSIQNQSLKKIEIIIVDDCSTDNSIKMFKDLQQFDSRIRIFYHLKNLGVWRTRLDGFLYSRAKYIIFFDAGDFYADNFILEDSFNLMTKYNLDSLRFGFKMLKIKNISNINKIKNKNTKNYYFKKANKIILGYNKYKVSSYRHGTIWNRILRKNILFKSFEVLDSYILNAYKNLWEDSWWNTLANINSYRTLFINRIGYIYI